MFDTIVQHSQPVTPPGLRLATEMAGKVVGPLLTATWRLPAPNTPSGAAPHGDTGP